jgi:hypothetical protein
VFVEDTETNDYVLEETSTGYWIKLNQSPALNSIIKVTYVSDSSSPFFNFGECDSNEVSIWASAFGRSVKAIGESSHAEGSGALAFGQSSHAEGGSSKAYGPESHAEGLGAEARGRASHAEGGSTSALGHYSHAQNFKTIAGYEHQTAIGRYNQNKLRNVFEIGNGYNNAGTEIRSNAFEVDWNGKTTIEGHSSPIGTLLTASASEQALEHNTPKALCSITLPAGSWIILAQVRFPSNGTGARRVNISTVSGYNAIHAQQDGTQNGITQMQSSLLAVNSSETTYYLNAVQYSGGMLTMPAGTADGYVNGLRAIRIA